MLLCLALAGMSQMAMAQTSTATATPKAPTAWQANPMRPCLVQGHYRQCVGVRLADVESDRQAKAFVAPPAGHAYVYVLRPHAQQSRQAATVSLDGVAGAVLGPMTYARLLVPAGRSELVVRADDELRLPLQLAGGQTYVLEYERVLMLGSIRPELRPLDLAVARRKMADASLVLPLAGQ